jgi:ERCC4-type nuclease
MVRKHGKTSEAESQCPITASPAFRSEADRQTDAIRDEFPRGVARPALRALFAAGLTSLESLARVSEAELAALHGMGPKAVSLLRSALRDKGLDFRKEGDAPR